MLKFEESCRLAKYIKFYIDVKLNTVISIRYVTLKTQHEVGCLDEIRDVGWAIMSDWGALWRICRQM